MTVGEMARLYYPRLWDKRRIAALAEAGRLTEAEKADILGGDTEETEA